MARSISYSTRNNSTSKIKVAFGGIMPGWPLDPNAKSGEHVSIALSPTDICNKQDMNTKISQ